MDRTADPNHRIDQLEQRMTTVESGLQDNTRLTNAIKTDTAKLLNLFQASKFGVAVIKWMATVGTGVLVAWTAWKGLPK